MCSQILLSAFLKLREEGSQMLMLWEAESEALPQPELKLVRRAKAEWVGSRTSGRGWPEYALTLAARGCVCLWLSNTDTLLLVDASRGH